MSAYQHSKQLTAACLLQSAEICYASCCSLQDHSATRLPAANRKQTQSAPCLFIAFSLLLLTYLALPIAQASEGAASLSVSTTTVTSDTPGYPRLGQIKVNNQNIFKADAGRSYQLINRFHYVTRESVIRREIWLRPGDPISPEDIAELERNIRDLDLFAKVQVGTTPSEALNDEQSSQLSTSKQGQPEEWVDLIVNTYDRLSIVASAGGSLLGGIGEVKFSIGDKNLFGLGHELLFGYSENTEGELLGSVSYDNVRLYGTDVYGGAQLGQTEEGNFASAFVQDRFQHHLDKLSWSVQLDRETTRQDFFEQGESIAEVPLQNERFRLNRIYRAGSRGNYWRYGPLLDFKRFDYSAATGTGADSVEVPEDNSSLFLGALLARDFVRAYRTVTNLDTIGYEQDIVLGSSIDLAFGLDRFESESEDKLLPSMFIRGWTYHALSEHNYLNLGLGSNIRINNDDFDGWSVSTAMTWFYTGFKRHTLAARMRYQSAFNREGLQPQQSLGEDNGLRGYPAREFNGEQSLLINLEHRLQARLDFGSVQIASVGFFDVGWVGDRGRSDSGNDFFDQPQSSAGLGLRIGSPQLLGSAVIRADLAYPFNEFNGREYSPSFSFALGQVFGYRP